MCPAWRFCLSVYLDLSPRSEPLMEPEGSQELETRNLHMALRLSGRSPNFRMSLASPKVPVAGALVAELLLRRMTQTPIVRVGAVPHEHCMIMERRDDALLRACRSDSGCRCRRPRARYRFRRLDHFVGGASIGGNKATAARHNRKRRAVDPRSLRQACHC